MLEHVAIQRIHGGIIDVWLEHPLAQVVEHHDTGHPAQPAEGLLVQFGPRLRAGAEHQQANRLAAVAERQHEYPCAPVLAAVRLADHGKSAASDREFSARRGLDSRAGLRQLLPTELTNESLDALICAGETIAIHQILPDGLGIANSGKPSFR